MKSGENNKLLKSVLVTQAYKRLQFLLNCSHSPKAYSEHITSSLVGSWLRYSPNSVSDRGRDEENDPPKGGDG